VCEHPWDAFLVCVAVCCRVLRGVAVCCSVLKFVAVCCSVLQCVAAFYSSEDSMRCRIFAGLFLWFSH